MIEVTDNYASSGRVEYNCTVSGNDGFGFSAIDNRGVLSVTDSTFSNNNCDGTNGGAITNWGAATVSNST